MMAAPCCRHISSLFLIILMAVAVMKKTRMKIMIIMTAMMAAMGDNIGIIKIMTKFVLLAGKIKSVWSLPGFTRRAAATAT